MIEKLLSFKEIISVNQDDLRNQRFTLKFASLSLAWRHDNHDMRRSINF